MNDFSHHIGSLLFKDRIDARGEFSRYCDNRFPCRPIARVAFEHRTVELSKLRVLTDGRPGRLDQFAAQPSVAATGNRTTCNAVSGGVFGGDQTEKPRQLAYVGDLLRIADTGQKMTGYDLTHPGNGFQKGHRLRQLSVLSIEAANLFNRSKSSFLARLPTLPSIDPA